MGARSALTQIGKWWTRLIGLAFGYGVSENVRGCIPIPDEDI